MKYWRALFITLFLFPAHAFAASNPDALPNAAQEERAKLLQKQFRCVVCQGQSIDDSNAALAGDMRRLIRTRIQLGDSDQEIADYLVRRYGDFVLMKPPVRGDTLLLWIMPFLVLAGGALAAILLIRRAKSPKNPA